MANPLVEAMKIGEEKARQEMQVAGAYDQYKPNQWEKEYTDDTYKNLGIPLNKQGDEEIEQLNIPGLLDLAQQLQIGPRDVEMAMEMWPNLKGLGINIPKDKNDPTGYDNPYGENPTPGHPDWQLANLLNDLTITGGNKNAAKNLKILKGADRGVPNADRFVEKKGLGAILPNLDQASLTPEALNALRKATEKGLSSREIRDIIKPFTKPDQFGHPSGSLI